MPLKEDIDKIKANLSIVAHDLEEVKKYADVPVFQVPQHYHDFLSRFKIVVHGATKFERRINFRFHSPYAHVFYTKDFGDNCSMALIGVEDLDEGMEPDGWTDVLLPVFYSNKALNQCGGEPFTKYIFYVDMTMTGAYDKELWFYTKGEWKLLFRYSANQMYIKDEEVTTCVGYIEYDPEEDNVCIPILE